MMFANECVFSRKSVRTRSDKQASEARCGAEKVRVLAWSECVSEQRPKEGVPITQAATFGFQLDSSAIALTQDSEH